jgi:hypothetical protein
VAIEVLTPAPAVVEIGDTITLHARVLDQQGDSILGAPIRWRTPDSTVWVDSLTGKFTGLSGSTGRVQAVSGSLAGPLTAFTVHPRSDTLIVLNDSLFVLTADTASAPLDPEVTDSLLAGLADRRIAVSLVAPSPAGARLTGDVVSDTVTTGANGQPLTAIRVRKVGVASGDSVIVQVSAKRPSGAVVPGSGRHIRVFFQ